MNIPPIYAEILERNKPLKGAVYSTLETFGQIYSESKLYFFEEYTDHGIHHIEAVLRSSIDIISEETITDFLDDENVAALLLAVLLHDLGMHQSPKTFRHLIQQRKILFPDLDSLCWHDLWENYTEEAKKFNSQQKKEIYGDYDYVVTIPTLDDIDDLNGNQKKLIGEFIRRHHARLAHEIAVYGFETGDEVIKFAENYEQDKLDIIGLIARSHGMDIRDTYSYLQKKYSRVNKKPYGIHVYYLMIILRLSDYFQIDIARLSIISLKLKTFRSPVSETEHYKHFSIKEIREVDDDPETLFIRALPATNFIYWKLIELIREIQNELDVSWAIIGEKYGKDKLKPLLKYRKVISNLEEIGYKESITFVPEKILFDAHPDLAKLLVAPLYGNNPTYGVRELLQNSLDAIQERTFLQKLDKEFDSLIEINILHDSKEQYFFEIKDNGKGMNAKEIKNYFLRAGSTNRKSKEWDDLYLDINRNSKVLKSGKFGVGILAAFLIGDELEVKTKRFDSDIGLCFKAHINSKDIEVTKNQDCPIGTTIRIQIKKEAFEFFKNPSTQLVPWDKWYTLKKPRITYNCILEYNQRKVGYEEYDPSYFESDWRWVEFSSTGYSKLRWSYVSKYIPYESNYQLTCNGLIIPSPPSIFSGSIPPPHIQVFDFNGIFPINLSRNNLDSNKLPFEKELVNSVYKEILTRILSIDPEITISSGAISLPKRITYPKLFGKLSMDDFFSGYLYSLEGYCLKNGYINDLVRNNKVLELSILRNENLISLPIKFNESFFVEISRFQKEIIKGYADVSIEKKRIEWIIYPETDTGDNLFEGDSDYKKEMKKIKTKDFTIFKRNDVKTLPIYLGAMSEFELDHLQSIICYSRKGYVVNKMNRQFNNFLAGIFSDLGDVFIPYEEEARKIRIREILEIAGQQND